MRHDVLYVCQLRKAATAVDLEGDLASLQRDLQRDRLVSRAIEHRLAFQGRSLVPRQFDLLSDPLRLVLGSGETAQRRQVGLITMFVRNQVLVMPASHACQHRVCHVEDWLRTSIVGRQGHCSTAGKLIPELQHVAVIGPTEAVNALGIVTDNHDVAMLRCQ